MRANPDSELHRLGKMFGVLVCKSIQPSAASYQSIAAFSAK